MMPQEPTRTARIEARIAPDALAIIKRAAAVQGCSVSDFAVAAARSGSRPRALAVSLITLLVAAEHS